MVWSGRFCVAVLQWNGHAEVIFRPYTISENARLPRGGSEPFGFGEEAERHNEQQNLNADGSPNEAIQER
jgi:hypothetical protein